MTDEEGGNHGSIGDTVDPVLCLSYRKHIETKIENMEKSFISTMKIVGAVTTLILAIIQLGLHFLG